MRGTAPTPPPIAIRRALEEGWDGFRRGSSTLIPFTLVVGGLNVLCQLAIRLSGERIVNVYGQTDPLARGFLVLAWLAYLLSNLWLVVGLLRGANTALERQRPRLRDLLRLDGRALMRAGGTLALVLLVLAVIFRLAQASAWLLALLQPLLLALPLLAGAAAVVYVVTDQVLSLPLSVLGGHGPMEAFRRGRAAIDPHWLQALGLTLLLGLVLLSGFLLLVVGLAASLPVAACILVAAYRQLFPAQPPRRLQAQPQPVQPQRKRP
ncbi:hypothetical protein KBY96_10365 [Cyanobium sp. ATX 6A2]|uniref:hypothetical protein n=1 Tax=Cyanobium sp. ATX 6A2 TaxID=2823700 RepID=UPI0020CCA856|nr:hypothetical protein [Cyanobium sp. ATX 6A2]MCP9888328.1 hypothetical protein [Cyanobium sp. ATX 6A2]